MGLTLIFLLFENLSSVGSPTVLSLYIYNYRYFLPINWFPIFREKLYVSHHQDVMWLWSHKEILYSCEGNFTRLLLENL